MRYVVKYKTLASDGIDHAWAPKGAAFECDKAAALVRFEHLVACGKAGARVDGLSIEHVRIEDRLIAAPKSKWEAMTNVMLAQYIADDEAVGPWADRKAVA